MRFQQLLIPDLAYSLHTVEYVYDALARLKEARYNPAGNTGAGDADLLRRHQFTYDLAGNRLSEAVALNGGSPTTQSYTYNTANQISSGSYAYDNNGNLTSDGTNTYTWDRANRLLSMGGAAYKYDGYGNRIQQTVGATVTKYLLDLQPGLPVVVAETVGANVTRFVHAPRGIHAHKDASNNWEWMVQDGLGSVRGVDSNTVTVLESRSYTPYGVPFGATGSSQTPYGFTGEPTDSNSLLYLRARYYNPAAGVFAALDPFEGVEDEPMSLNGYTYVHGNPVNFADPSGEILPLLVVASGALIGGVIGTVSGGWVGGTIYDWAYGGNCGCQREQWARSTDRNSFVNQVALLGGISGAVLGGLSVIPGGAIAAGVVGVGLGVVGAGRSVLDMIQNDPNKCNALELALSLLGIITGGIAASGGSVNVPIPRIGGPNLGLVPANGGIIPVPAGGVVSIPVPVVPPIAGVWNFANDKKVTIEGQPEQPHELAQAQRFGRIYGGGRFKFLGNSSRGIEGFFKPTNGNIPEFPVSLKDFGGTGKLPNIIGRINRNANQVTTAGYAGDTVLHVSLRQFLANDIGNFVQNGPIKNMPTEPGGAFSVLFFEGADGLVVVELSGVHITGIP